MNVMCSWSFHVESAHPAAMVVDEVERVMTELLALEESDARLSDSAVALDLETMTVEIALSAVGDTFEGAIEMALAAIRTAIHAAGGSTPDWPSVAPRMPKETSEGGGIVYQRGELTVS